MKKNILVTSNCQTGGIAGALTQLFPEHKISPVHTTQARNPAFFNRDNPTVAEADVWISSEGFPNIDALNEGGWRPQLISFASMSFRGFHPDSTYLIRRGGGPLNGKRFEPAYHSRIVALCYMHGISRDETASFFNRDVFSRLNYFDYYRSQKSAIERAFMKSELDYASFFPKIQRQGVFMYTINHPKGFVLDQIARIVAVKLTGQKSFLQAELNTIDTLSGTLWPIYPAIGDYYAVPSSYVWIEKNKVRFNNLEEFIDFHYQTYEEQGLTKENGSLQGPAITIDALRGK